MRERLIEKAVGLGFAEAWFLPPEPLSYEPGDAKYAGFGLERLLWNAPSLYPWARCVILLAWAYTPHPAGEPIPAYYLASNRAYKAACGMAEGIRGMGFSAQLAPIPARALALKNGIGVQGRNGLLRIGRYGSRTVLFTIVTDAAGPCVPVPAFDSGECGGCALCAAACPAKAIGEEGLEPRACLRAGMQVAMHCDRVKELTPGFLGCELCQAACPHNLSVGFCEPDDEAVSAFSLKRLIRGDASKARKLVGRNYTGNGKLTAEAIALSARKGIHAELIAGAADSPFLAVRDAVDWALNRREGRQDDAID